MESGGAAPARALSGRPAVAVVGFPNAGKSTLRQPPGRRPRGGDRCGARCHPGPACPRGRVERAELRPDRHRRGGPGRLGRARPSGSVPGAGGDRRRRRDPDGGRCEGRPRTWGRRAGGSAAALRATGGGRGEQDRSSRGRVRRGRAQLPGLGEPLPVSASHGLGTGDLLDRLVEELRRHAVEAGDEVEDDAVPRIAILGRPNVGKSSLLNALLGSERVIVSERAGTTRDPVDTEAEVEGQRVVLVDTAGLRRRAKVAGTVGYYAQLRSERAAERADAAIVVCDASRGPHRGGPARR